MTPVERTMAMLLPAACLLGGGCDEPLRERGDIPAMPTAAVARGAEAADLATTPGPDTAATGAPAALSRSAWPAGRVDVTFDDLKFDLQKDEPFERGMLTARIEQLQGRDVRIRGYILPSFQQHGITQFVLVRDNMQCCFGPGAALYDCILVEMEPDRSTSYTVRPVTVGGLFAIRELQGPDGGHLAIYHITGRQVK